MRGLLGFTKASRRLHLFQFYQLFLQNANCTSKTQCCKSLISDIRGSFHTSSPIKSVQEGAKDKATGGNSTSTTEKKKKEKLTYITLIAPNSHVTVSTLEDATKLATRRDLKLIKIKDYQTHARKDRQTYQLLTKAQYLEEEKNSKTLDTQKENSTKKKIKLLSVSSKINDHDVKSKINNIMRWLTKHNEVRVAISNDNGEAESVYDKIAEGVKEIGRIVQKREKGTEIRFQILPPKQDSSTATSSES